ncbi:DEAD/DEAH box helicase [Bartonella sp. F02]|uniref:DEAD/DEAH box helicase n=1 Tax=Bartonella sp. F02 TaxID=2967262 RepID=UPI0022A99814|nr:DEAD/DEAH box helicase [Bartonella sp. F02]MCZ2328624.1 DEAD/DEAH box helicase [Bartonella sp. F02]
MDKVNSFTALGLPSVITKNLIATGIVKPKPIQEKTIPMMLEGRDILGIAQTGSGKTLAFGLPVVSQILNLGDKRFPKTARALILVPTRELAVQIEETIRLVTKGAHLSTCLILGGVSRFTQIKRMKAGVDILIATPGRLMDLVREKYIDLSQSHFLILDEADRMLDMGFINDVQKIAKLLHEKRKTALFSATMPKEIIALANSLLNDPVKIEIVPQGTTATEIVQKLYCIPTREKKNALSKLLTNPALTSVIVFTRTKHGADAVSHYLEKTGYSVATIHGNKSQNARQRALKAFREGAVRVLVATDIAARGIDVPGISHVINYDLPDEAESYVHRIGRTGRNGASGDAITLFDKDIEGARLRAVERLIRIKLIREEIPPQFGEFPEKPILLKPEINIKKRYFKKAQRKKISSFRADTAMRVDNRQSASKSGKSKKETKTTKDRKLFRVRKI